MITCEKRVKDSLIRKINKEIRKVDHLKNFAPKLNKFGEVLMMEGKLQGLHTAKGLIKKWLQ